jgi:CRP-like cAMP-binding protein
MASRSALVQALQSVPLFAGCNRRDLGHIAKSGVEVKQPEGALVVDQGQMGKEALIILDGSVAVRRGGRKIAGLGRGDVVGELSLLDHGPRTASVVCETDCTFFVLDAKQFHKVLRDQPNIAITLLGTLAGRIREFDRKYFG